MEYSKENFPALIIITMIPLPEVMVKTIPGSQLAPKNNEIQ